MTSNAYHHGRLRSALLEEAREHVRSRGPSAVSIRSVARAVGVSHAAAYRHYRNRRHLLAAVAADALAGLAGALEEAKVSAGQAGEIEALAEAYVRWALAEPEALRLAFAAELWNKQDLPALRAAADRASQPLVDAVSAVVPDDPERMRSLAVAIWAQVHGMAVLACDRQLSQGELRVDGSTAEAVVAASLPAIRALVGGWAGSRTGEAG